MASINRTSRRILRIDATGTRGIGVFRCIAQFAQVVEPNRHVANVRNRYRIGEAEAGCGPDSSEQAGSGEYNDIEHSIEGTIRLHSAVSTERIVLGLLIID